MPLHSTLIKKLLTFEKFCQFADETVDETRLRLAKKYLDTVKQDTVAAEDEDDAMTFNQDAIAHRLQQDVSEAKGRHYTLVADKVAAGLASAGAHRFYVATNCL